ncbi:proteasome adapter and scaffold protein ECM29 [Cylas formicarius]|uniref:proteasome adapter and scaffold protein ECM29 n=1 Tax=Cylas formicarius TaxID=197179 RepID=UPI00295841FE|nr:proteasome adapter and scaffold protein ECM29 [Cylas formicarius]
MAQAVDELMLLERVFLRLGAAETDEQLQNVLCKFLPPVLLKLSSQQGVRKKVMELLIHINKRVKTRPQVQLPVEALLTQYQDPSATSFVTNFTIIYLKLGFPRLPIEKQAELVPTVLSALENKPVSHLDSLLLLLVPLLGKVKVPTEPEKISTLFGLHEKPHISKHLLEILLDMLLLPYSAVSLQTNDSAPGVSLPVPAGMSEASYKRVTANNPMKPEDLEEIKLGIVKFLAYGVFKNEDILIHLVVAAADTRFGVANLADMELKKVVGSVDWSLPTISQPLFTLFLGTKPSKPEQVKVPANTRIRLKLLTYLCKVTGAAFTFPASIQVIFNSLYGENTNTRLKTLALNFTDNLIRYAVGDSVGKVAPVLLAGLQKLVKEGEEVHQSQAYIVTGKLAQKFPEVVFHDVGILELYFTNLETAAQEMKIQIREGLLSLIQAYKHDIFSKECDKDGRLDILFALVKVKMNSHEPVVRFVGVRTLATIFPPSHVPSKFLLLVATGDSAGDVSSEAFKAIYGTARKNDIDFAKDGSKGVTLSFEELTKHVVNEADANMADKSKVVNFGNHALPFDVRTYAEIVLYLRLCLINTLDVPLTREVLRHPCQYTPIITKHLRDVYAGNGERANALSQYGSLLRKLLLANPALESFCSTIELVGSVPQLRLMSNDLTWIRDQLSSTREELRECCAVLYALVLPDSDLDIAVGSLLNQVTSKSLEAQQGALLAVGSCLETHLLKSRRDISNQKRDLVKKFIFETVPFLKHANQFLVGAACTTLGLVARVAGLPLDDGKPVKVGSPDAKKPAIDGVTKIDIVERLLDVMNNNKLSAKVRERAAKSLGLLCVGERFPHTREVLQGLLDTAKETKDVEVHFTIGESLVMCCQSVWSPEARNGWDTSPQDYAPDDVGPMPDDDLDWLLNELFSLAKQTHPNSKQASCIWLLALIKGCGDRGPISKQIPALQNTFMDFLSQNNDIVQDAASKGLCVLYDTYKSQDLLTALVKQLTSGTRNVSQVTSDTKLFEEGQLGTAPTGGNLTTYKELCSLASDLNKPDLIYQFMHLANHNAIWNSKKGAAFGFSSIAEKCGEDLKAHMAAIIPKLYRYQYDPTPGIQASMQNIWRVLVSEPQKMLDEYYNEILKDLLDNLNSSQYRVRQSCCLALQDFLKGSANRSIHDAVDSMDEIWTKLFRVMDDHHEATRLAATKTTRVLSKLCIRGCDISQGKAGVKMVEAILPSLLNVGITHTVTEIRLISLSTVSELVNSAGKQLKPFLAKLIPALLQATGELESVKLSYLSTMMGNQTHMQEAIDNARASMAKSHFTMDTVSKSLQYADNSILEELVPKTIDLMKGSVGLGTRIACAHFITMLVVQLGKDVQPYAGKFLAALVNGLTDRNAAVRKHYASAIGHLVGSARESSLEKLFDKLRDWYLEREDDTIRSACAQTVQSIGIHNQEVLKAHSEVILPLVFFAMHAEKTSETENTLDTWTEIWSEHSPGTEAGIRQHIGRICEVLRNGLESASWTTKAQAANAVATVANKLGTGMESEHRNALLKILLTGLSGRTWSGKDKLLKALTSICSNCKDAIKADNEVNPSEIVDAILKESKKDEILYKKSALECLGEVLTSFEMDAFERVYHIIQPVLSRVDVKPEEDDPGAEETSKYRENFIRLKETSYETLGKAWPANGTDTQEKYGGMFADHIRDTLPCVTRTVQVSMMSALYGFVDKLILLKKDGGLTSGETKRLADIEDAILEAVKYSLSISKHTKMKKEALNVVFCLCTRLKDKRLDVELGRLRETFDAALPDLENDRQPEIRSRVTDIKKLLN